MVTSSLSGKTIDLNPNDSQTTRTRKRSTPRSPITPLELGEGTRALKHELSGWRHRVDVLLI
jgi:hypothetical protein